MEVEVRDYFVAMRRHWRFFLAGLFACVTLAAVLAWTRPPVYEARTQFFVTAGANAADLSQSYQGGLFVQQRVLSYAQIISSKGVAQPIIDKLGLPVTTQRFSQLVTASVPANTNIVNVTVHDRSPRVAMAIATALARSFPAYVNALEQPTGSVRSPVKVSVTNPPQLPSKPTSPHKALDLAVGALIGLAVGVGGSVLLETQSRRRRIEELQWAPSTAEAGLALDAGKHRARA